MTGTRIVSNEELQLALDFLRDNAPKIGLATERAVKAGHMLKYCEALSYKQSDASTAAAKQADARTSDRYLEAVVEDAKASGDLAQLRSLSKAAEMKIDAWRSEQANYRAMKI